LQTFNGAFNLSLGLPQARSTDPVEIVHTGYVHPGGQMVLVLIVEVGEVADLFLWTALASNQNISRLDPIGFLLPMARTRCMHRSQVALEAIGIFLAGLGDLAIDLLHRSCSEGKECLLANTGDFARPPHQLQINKHIADFEVLVRKRWGMRPWCRTTGSASFGG
jgi:hypothetical protein